MSVCPIARPKSQVAVCYGGFFPFFFVEVITVIVHTPVVGEPAPHSTCVEERNGKSVVGQSDHTAVP